MLAIAVWPLAALLCSAAANAQSDASSIEKTFVSPPENARVMMRWWWFGPAVTKPELARELQQMKAGGIGGFEIQPVYPLALDDPKTGFRNLPYLSDEFRDDVRFVNQEASRLGLRASLTLASGWPYGGPHTPVSEAAGALRLLTMPIPSGADSVPVPALENGEKLVGVFLAQGAWSAAGAGAPAMLALPAAGETRLALPTASGGSERTVLWFVSSRTGQQVKRAAVDADGFVLDHFSREAVEAHLHQVADRLMTAFEDRPPYSVFSDSLEVYGADWTPGFLEEFRNRRGYDLLPHLPELFTLQPSEEALEVRHDWGQTLTELIDENYLKPIDAWARAHHTLFRSQTYGDPAVSLASNALAALPEGEGPQWQRFSYTRWASSAAHVYGRPVVSSETWTWLHSPAFRATPLDMKAEADRFFLQGINQLVGHGWPYSPPSAGEPGWRFYAAGAFNTHNPWWIVMPDVMRYMQRVSWILRQGEPANEVAVYLPEEDAYAAFTPGKVSLTDRMPLWITPALTQAIENSGHNFDYIDSAAIEARGIHYPLLILPHVDRISPATLARIEQYCEQGGKVIALSALPSQAPGLPDHAAQSATVAAMSRKLLSCSGRVQVIPKAGDLARSLQDELPPDMRLDTPAPQVGFIHRKLARADIYFVANTGNTPVQTQAHFGSSFHTGEWLNPDTGESHAVKADGALTLDLAPYQSRILLLHDGAAAPGATPATQQTRIADLSNDWHVQFAGSPQVAPREMPSLTSWTDNPSTLYYSGIAIYRRTFSLATPASRSARLVLSFGAGKPLPAPSGDSKAPGMQAWFDPPIRDAAVVSINGKRAGSLWHPPYELDVTPFLQPGVNSIEVQVANTAINELAGEALPDDRLLSARYGRRFVPQGMENLKPLPSGLLGSVELLSRSAE